MTRWGKPCKLSGNWSRASKSGKKWNCRPGGLIRHGRFRRFETVSEMDRVLDAANDASVSARMQQQLSSIWPDIRPQLERSLEVRQQNRINGMKRQLAQYANNNFIDLILEPTEKNRFLA